MSAITVVRDKCLAHLVTDLGVFDDEGILIAENSKITVLPHLNAVAALRGVGLHIPVLHSSLASCTSFDDLKARAPEAAKHTLNLVGDLFGWQAAALKEFEFIVAGVNDDGAAESFLVATHGRHGAPFTVIELDEIAMLPKSGVAEATLATQPAKRLADGTIDIDHFGRKALELQRAEKTLNATGKLVHLVGGGILVTTVRRDSISSRIIHRWDDKVGEKIFASEGGVREEFLQFVNAASSSATKSLGRN